MDLPFIDHASKDNELRQEALPKAQKAGQDLTPLAQLYAPGRLLYIRQTGTLVLKIMMAHMGCGCDDSSLMGTEMANAARYMALQAAFASPVLQLTWAVLYPTGFQCAGADSSKYEILEAADPSQRFERILLNRAMFHDHLCTTYLARLQDIIAGLSPPDS